VDIWLIPMPVKHEYPMPIKIREQNFYLYPSQNLSADSNYRRVSNLIGLIATVSTFQAIVRCGSFAESRSSEVVLF